MYRFPMSPQGCKMVAEEMQRKSAARAALAAAKQATAPPDPGPQGPRSHYRWPAGIGYHAGALAALALFGGIAVWVYEVWK